MEFHWYCPLTKDFVNYRYFALCDQLRTVLFSGIWAIKDIAGNLLFWALTSALNWYPKQEGSKYEEAKISVTVSSELYLYWE